MVELAALSLTASGGRRRESEKAQRSKFIGKLRRNEFWEPQESHARFINLSKYTEYADVVELADTQDLGSCTARCAGSSPVIRTNKPKSPARVSGFAFIFILF